MAIFISLLATVAAIFFSSYLLWWYNKTAETSYGISAWIAGMIAMVFAIVAIGLACPPRVTNPWDLTGDEDNALYQCSRTEQCDPAALHRSFMQARTIVVPNPSN